MGDGCACVHVCVRMCSSLHVCIYVRVQQWFSVSEIENTVLAQLLYAPPFCIAVQQKKKGGAFN